MSCPCHLHHCSVEDSASLCNLTNLHHYKNYCSDFSVSPQPWLGTYSTIQNLVSYLFLHRLFYLTTGFILTIILQINKDTYKTQILHKLHHFISQVTVMRTSYTTYIKLFSHLGQHPFIPTHLGPSSIIHCPMYSIFRSICEHLKPYKETSRLVLYILSERTYHKSNGFDSCSFIHPLPCLTKICIIAC